MRINQDITRGTYAPATSSARETSRAAQESRTAYLRGQPDYAFDRVEVSELADTVSNVLAADANARAAKISALSNQVQSGTYRVDAAALSDAMVRDAQESYAAGGTAG